MIMNTLKLNTMCIVFLKFLPLEPAMNDMIIAFSGRVTRFASWNKLCTVLNCDSVKHKSSIFTDDKFVDALTILPVTVVNEGCDEFIRFVSLGTIVFEVSARCML
uniref:Secreted protein n=1 Tax=Schistosoma curassoni TaxID=6186 RepID=A0A183L2F9_9TREM